MPYPLDLQQTCSSGNVSGTNADVATCVVVKVSLANFVLRGVLNYTDSAQDTLCSLQWLQILDVRNNNLEGPLPNPQGTVCSPPPPPPPLDCV